MAKQRINGVRIGAEYDGPGMFIDGGHLWYVEKIWADEPGCMLARDISVVTGGEIKRLLDASEKETR